MSVSCSVVSVSNNVSPWWIDTDHVLSKLQVRLLNTVIPTENTGVVGSVAVVVPEIKILRRYGQTILTIKLPKM